ncbi:MAG TPA: hypothetical protein PKD96_00485 [Candidatus Absconditabacterales bacterium]|nr:hypothetical protein [Candidatus Absconditabacterales bacterium]HMT26757.1 hypothetical protein [Candidatus Absconditabacterales bacterium]
MTIGICATSVEMLALLSFFRPLHYHFVVYLDLNEGFLGDKTYDDSFLALQKAVDFLSDKCDKIIVPPVYEFGFSSSEKILPLFQSYLKEYCFGQSIVGKLGFLAEYADVEQIENHINHFSKNFSLTTAQKNTKKFHFPWALWIKKVPLRKYFSLHLGNQNPSVVKLIKNDLKYFKDASIDTLIPLNYSFFLYQKTISSYFATSKKYKFHDSKVLVSLLQSLLPSSEKNSQLTIYYSGNLQPILDQKKRMRILSRGNTVTVNRKKI